MIPSGNHSCKALVQFLGLSHLWWLDCTTISFFFLKIMTCQKNRSKHNYILPFPTFSLIQWFKNIRQPPGASSKQTVLSCPQKSKPATGLAASSQAGVARKMLASMPDRAKQIIFDGDFGGSQLVMLASDIHRPSFKDPFSQNTWSSQRWMCIDWYRGATKKCGNWRGKRVKTFCTRT